ncbi:MAG: phytanoyl-CoA dioxygenase family protein [Rhodospirillaceae bacterium]
MTALSLETITKRETWAALAPRLHIEDESLLRAARPIVLDPARVIAIREQLLLDGYFQQSDVPLSVDLALMAETVRKFSNEGLSPVFTFLYDEFWLPFCQLDSLLRDLLGGYAILPDFWVWNVDPQKGDSGWTPHRDKGGATLRPDGSPNSITVWIPLTEATPLTSCMYVVPARHDPTYGTNREGEWRFELPSIRALPAKPGDVLAWNQAVLHWGSKSSPLATESRVSMAVEFQRTDVPPMNPPLLKPAQLMPFDQRLKLIAKQVLQYRHMYKVAPELEQLMMKLVV